MHAYRPILVCALLCHQTCFARHAQFSSDNPVCLSVGVDESALALDRHGFSSILCRNAGVPYLPQGSDTHRSCTGNRASQAFQCSPAAQKSCQQSLMHLLPMSYSSCMRLRHFCIHASCKQVNSVGCLHAVVILPKDLGMCKHYLWLLLDCGQHFDSSQGMLPDILRLSASDIVTKFRQPT